VAERAGHVPQPEEQGLRPRGERERDRHRAVRAGQLLERGPGLEVDGEGRERRAHDVLPFVQGAEEQVGRADLGGVLAPGLLLRAEQRPSRADREPLDPRGRVQGDPV
jgi:hypothetical protein